MAICHAHQQQHVQEPQPNTLPQTCSQSQPYSRRSLLRAAPAAAAAVSLWPAVASAITVEDVTPAIAPSGPLTSGEQSIITIFNTAAPAVASVFDVTLMVSLQQLIDAPGQGRGVHPIQPVAAPSQAVRLYAGTTHYVQPHKSI